MPKTHEITQEQAAEIAKVRKGIQDAAVDKRMRAVQLRGEGKKNPEIAETVESVSKVVSRWVSDYVKGGIEALLPKNHGGNRRNLSFAEEAELLSAFKEKAAQGQIVEVSDIEAAYREKVGRDIGNGQIYRVLKRQGWRKVKPRSRHPKKAPPEVVEASKKLTIDSES